MAKYRVLEKDLYKKMFSKGSTSPANEKKTPSQEEMKKEENKSLNKSKDELIQKLKYFISKLNYRN